MNKWDEDDLAYAAEKSEQALLLIMLQQTKILPKIGTRLDPAVRVERERLNARLKELKHVAWA